MLELCDVEKTLELLMWMAQDFHPSFHRDDIADAALEVIIKHVDAAIGGALGSLHTASVAKLSALVDIMMLTKDGSPKDVNATLDLMRWLATFRDEIRATSSDNATEHVELDEDEVSLCYRRFGRSLLTDALLPHQRRDKRYRLRNNFEGDTHLSTFQRSFTDNVLRRFLGDKRVAYLIWQHGLPGIADGRLLYHQQVDSKVIDMGMLQSGLEECIQWYIALADDIVVHQSQEGFDAQVSASSLARHERQRRQTRREALLIIRKSLRLGAYLSKQRDSKKRSYDEMNDDEQKILEDYETGKTKRLKQAYTTQRIQPFRCNLGADND